MRQDLSTIVANQEEDVTTLLIVETEDTLMPELKRIAGMTLEECKKMFELQKAIQHFDIDPVAEYQTPLEAALAWKGLPPTMMLWVTDQFPMKEFLALTELENSYNVVMVNPKPES